MRPRRSDRWAVLLPTWVWLCIAVLLPFLIVFRISLSEKVTAQPPYRPVFTWDDGLSGLWNALGELGFSNYLSIFDDPLLWNAYISSLTLAGISTVVALLVGLMLAVPMARAPRHVQPVLIILVVLPFLTSFLIRAYAWIAILKQEGFLNMALVAVGVIETPLAMLNTDAAIVIGIVYSYLPFMVLPLFSSLEKMDKSLPEAAADLGARPWQTFYLVTVPAIRPGIIAGCGLVFIPAIGEFIIPDLLGGSDTLMIGRQLWSEFFSNRDWPLASALAIMLLCITLLPVIRGQKHSGAR